MELSHLSNRELKIMLTKMLSKVRRAMKEQSKNFNREKLFLKYSLKY